MLPIIIAAFCCLIVGYCYQFFVKNRQNLPPGPIPLPFLGNLFQLDAREPQKTLAKWSQKYGPIYTVWIGPLVNFVVSDFGLIKDYFLKQGDIFCGRQQNFVFDYISSNSRGIIFTERYYWREQRGFFLQVLRNLQGAGKSVIEDKIMVEIHRLVQQIEHVLERENGKMSLKNSLELCVGNVLYRILFGYDLSVENTQFEHLKQHLEHYFKSMGKPEVALLSVYPWLRYVPLYGGYRSLPYTVATLNEIQRHANIVPMNVPRRVSEDVVIAGHTVKKGSVIIPEISAILHDPVVFSNPEKFEPEKFLVEGKQLREVEQFLPFSVGPRRCLGESVAKMILFLVFSNLIRVFSFGKGIIHKLRDTFSQVSGHVRGRRLS